MTRQSYATLSGALHARRWARIFKTRKGRWPTVEERVLWIARMFQDGKVDVVYVNQAVELQERPPCS